MECPRCKLTVGEAEFQHRNGGTFHKIQSPVAGGGYRWCGPVTLPEKEKADGGQGG